MYWSSTICGAIPVAFCGSPSVSNGFSCTWQPGLAALCLSMANWTPFLMLMPSAASGPLSGPAIAIDTGGQGGLAIAGGVGRRGTLGGFDFPTVLVDLHLLDDLQIGRRRSPTGSWDWVQPAMPSTTSSWRYREQPAPRTMRPRTFTSGSMFLSASTIQLRKAWPLTLRVNIANAWPWCAFSVYC